MLEEDVFCNYCGERVVIDKYASIRKIAYGGCLFMIGEAIVIGLISFKAYNCNIFLPLFFILCGLITLYKVSENKCEDCLYLALGTIITVVLSAVWYEIFGDSILEESKGTFLMLMIGKMKSFYLMLLGCLMLVYSGLSSLRMKMQDMDTVEYTSIEALIVWLVSKNKLLGVKCFNWLLVGGTTGIIFLIMVNFTIP